MEISLELSDLVAMQSKHTMWIYSLKIGNWKTSCQTLIKYISNDLEENDKKEKDPINIGFITQKTDPEVIKMLLTWGNRVYKKKKRKILPWLTSLRIKKKQADDEYFPKK